MRKIWIAFSCCVFILLIISGCANTTSSYEKTPMATPSQHTIPLPISTAQAASPIGLGARSYQHAFKGNPNADVVLEEWADAECPACASIYPVVSSLMQKYDADVKLVYRHFPLTQIHPQAMSAAEAVEAAGEQGAFWPMLERLYQHQQSLGVELYHQTASELGLDLTRFDAALQDHKYLAKIQQDLLEATQKQLPGTPTFVLNGQILNPHSISDLERAVQAAVSDKHK